MSTSKIPAALAAADMFLTALCEGKVPPCFTPKNEAIALGLNAAVQALRWFRKEPRGVFAPGSKITELRDLVRAACEELEGKGDELARWLPEDDRPPEARAEEVGRIRRAFESCGAAGANLAEMAEDLAAKIAAATGKDMPS